MKEAKLTSKEKELVEYMKTACDFIEDKHLRNMVAVKIMSRATGSLLANRGNTLQDLKEMIEKYKNPKPRREDFETEEHFETNMQGWLTENILLGSLLKELSKHE